jgi:hypothetical protein
MGDSQNWGAPFYRWLPKTKNLEDILGSHSVMHPYLFHRPLIVRPPCVFVGTVIPSVMLPVHAHLVRGYPSHL